MILQTLETADRLPVAVDGRRMYSSARYEMVHLALQPGEGMEPHAMPFDVVFFVIEGSGSLLVGEDEITVTENTAVHVEKGATRRWRNAQNKTLRILVNKILE